MVISFSHPLARAQLLEKGRVYTFRKKRRKKVGNDWANEGRLKPKMCNVHIIEVGEVDIGDLSLYAYESGFKSSTEWYKAIMELNGGKWDVQRKGWLYHIVKDRRSSRTGSK